ncbi:MAG: cytochrome b N-terminal domain-containing protein [Gemmatimonadota bacterium]|nr:cytochrome b N-terminal domain-containing protein [Gemmatimonadota bacterium]
MRALLDWLDNRTGYRSILSEALYERIPGGARWRYVWGSTLAFAIGVQFITGLILWAAYSANAQGAWESVYFIQYEMWGGWMLRGIHHYMAHVTIVLLLLHLMQVVIDGAYRAPREVNFWFGLGLLGLVLGLGLTGYLLPWDQKGFWATKVATSIAAITPFVGPEVQRFMVGGAEYGHLTLTRFFAVHAGIIPALIVALIVGHVYLFRHHGITVKDPERAPEATFWPEQVFRDAVAMLAVMATVLVLVFVTGGAELGAPADPTEPYAAARPEWYFMFLFQWLKYFPAGWEVVGAMIIPGAIVAVVALMPIIGNWQLGHRFNLGLMGALIAGIGLLTVLAYAQDAGDEEFAVAQEEAEQAAHRVRELANAPAGIPPTGALELLRNDPLTQGPKLFNSNCASCHTYEGHDGTGLPPAEEPTASDLAGFGSREWLEGLFDPDRVNTLEYFGGTEFRNGDMVRFVQRGIPNAWTDEQRDELEYVIKWLSAEANLPLQAELDSAEAADIERGREAVVNEVVNCKDCHTVYGEGEEDDGPDLTGWASREWVLRMVNNPAHPSLYGADNDRMPAFGEDGILTEREMGLLVDWLREDWYRPTEQQ